MRGKKKGQRKTHQNNILIQVHWELFSLSTKNIQLKSESCCNKNGRWQLNHLVNKLSYTETNQFMLKMAERFHSNHNFSSITQAIFIYFDFNFFLPPFSSFFLHLSPLLIHLHFYPSGRECGNFFINESKVLIMLHLFFSSVFLHSTLVQYKTWFCEKCENFCFLSDSLSKYSFILTC